VTEKIAALKMALAALGEVDDLPDWDGLQPHIRVAPYDPKAVLLRQGEASAVVQFVLSGLVKLGYESETGALITKSIIESGSAIASLSALEGGLNSFSAVAMEPTLIAKIPFCELKALMQKHHVWERVFRKVVTALALKKEKREFEFLALSPTQRWLNFKRDRGHLLERIPQAEIAALIGITPVALSRIKGRLSRGQDAYSVRGTEL
jgi:CRP-like cAMP-binding protein